MAKACPLCRIDVGGITVIGPKDKERQVEEAAKHLLKLCRSREVKYNSVDAALRELERAGVVEIVKRRDDLWKIGLLFDMITLFTLLGAPTITSLMLSETWYEVKLKDMSVCRGKPVRVWLE